MIVGRILDESTGSSTSAMKAPDDKAPARAAERRGRRRLKILVATVVHHPFDARVFEREIGALLSAGHEITYAAPWSAFDVEPPGDLVAIDLPQAQERQRMAALRAARAVTRSEADRHDLILLHNPELLLAVVGSPARHKAVFDIHEDIAAALVDKPYIPRLLRRPLAVLISWIERWAERNLKLILAENAYHDRFRQRHPVVHNEPEVPLNVQLPGTERVVYLGRVSDGRGLDQMIAAARRLLGSVRVEIMGWGDDVVVPTLEDAASSGVIEWAGRIGNAPALHHLDGAIAGLSLLHDLPNYRHSRPTKIVEYMARGIPVITTPLPVAVEIVERYDCGIVVPFGDVDAVVDAVHALVDDEALRHGMGQRGHRAAQEHFNWARSGPEFVKILEAWTTHHDVRSARPS